MADKASQTYATHGKLVIGFHVVLFGVLLLTLVGSCVNLYHSLGDHQRLYSASLLVVLTAATIVLSFYARLFALKAQDRAIRAEEQLRHYVLTGRLLDPRLSMRQVIGLRFAPDEEFVDLARRAAEEGLSEDGIKRAVKTWRPDTYRV
ncbi:MAG: DUF6526 family protein [Vicinamibacterales bacterium]|nr:DUF6526 family protein [Vicinamibacterales bacterium]